MSVRFFLNGCPKIGRCRPDGQLFSSIIGNLRQLRLFCLPINSGNTAGMSENKTKIAVITGVSSGLGKALALHFRSQGVTVVGVSRTQPDFELDGWIAADLTLPAGRQKVYDQIVEQYSAIDVLINNAGKGSYATWDEQSANELRALLELNFFAPVELTKLMLPLLRAAHGTVINISSMAGNLPVPCMGAYCVSKAAFSLYSDTLRMELLRDGVKVLKVMPGRINTGFSSRAFGPRKPPETPAGGDAGRFAAQVYRAWCSGRRSLIYPWWYRLLLPLPSWLPGLYEKKSAAMWKL